MILQDLRKCSAPAAMPLDRTWPSDRIWTVISGLWSFNPASRPSAFATAQVVKRTEFALPPNVIRRVITLVDADYYCYDESSNTEVWAARTRCLRSLCIVSRACCAWATPAMYRHIWLRNGTMPPSLLALNYSIASSIASPLPFNQVADGYGTYTESLIMDSTDNQNLRGGLSTVFQDLLYRMPRLRSVHIGSGPVHPLHSLATLTIKYECEDVFLVHEGIIIMAFSYLQRLSIRIVDKDWQPSFPAASSGLFLPHLRFIMIASYDPDNLYGLSSSFFLEALSGWKLPSLQYLNVYRLGTEHYSDALIGFLLGHGAALQYLSLQYYDSGYQISPGMLKNILALCPNLRSIHAGLEDLPALDQLPAHPNLEKISIEYDKGKHKGEEKRDADVYKTIQSLKSMIPTRFSKLIEVKFKRNYPDLTALFHAGDAHITVQTRGRVFRHHDGGRIELGALFLFSFSRNLHDVFGLGLLKLTRQT
jgi:hypothetical protein